ncbi:polysaccharide biosynthesis tyrosine autokinase [Caballeronia ptereochthonis]|uniref:Putative tyrosine-protein kinase EpsB n=1 Tax=Caballeronia ptereochthonis TaxID=1777144 RepID=A0A158BRV1_9BURK|nr:polysaccharide biosynthesis tyrosine autokinase [Caballeronia ptereochthonis]SAK72803.1 exopolysaccharide transport protein family protein [Caballeronia ptereochthonis]
MNDLFLQPSRHPVPAAGDDEIRLSEIFAVLRESRGLIALVTACTLAAGSLYAFLGTPTYRADVLVQVDDDSGSGTLNDKLGDLAALFQNKASTDAEIELMRSRSVIGDAVTRLHLDIDARPHYFPLVGAPYARYTAGDALARAPLRLGGYAWGGERIGVSTFDVPARQYDQAFTLIAGDGERYELRSPDGTTILRGRVGETETARGSAGPIRLTVMSLLARPGTRFDLKRASTQQTVADLQKDLKIAEKTKQSGIIGMSLDSANAERVTTTVNTIATLYVQRNVDRKSAQAQQMLAFLGDQLPQLRADLDRAEARYNAFRARNGAVDLEEQSKLLLQSVVDNRSKIVELQQQRADLVQRYTAMHPSVTAIDARIGELQRQSGDFEKQIGALPSVQQDAVRLLRDVKVSNDLYTNLLDSTQQLRVLKAGQLGNVRTVDYAVIPEKPVAPKKALTIALSLVFGFMAGCALALGRRMFNRGLETPAEIEQAIDLPVYAIISHSEQQAALQLSRRHVPTKPRVLADLSPNDVAVEGLRSLRTALQFGVLAPRNNVIMVTGPRPGIGKSFVAANFATVLAAGGQRVLLIDGDMRRGDLHRMFALPRKQGFAELLAGVEPDAVIHHDALAQLDVITGGSAPNLPAELLMRERFARVLDDLRARYDFVIIDSPPVLAVTDSALIGRHAGATLLVARHGSHSAAELVQTRHQLVSAGVQVDGVLLTDTPPRGMAYGAFSQYANRGE